MSDSSDDDRPLAALGKKGASSSDEAEFDEEAEEEEGDLAYEESVGEAPDSDEFIVEEDDDDDDEDGDYASDASDSDIPLAALASKKSPPKKKAEKKKEKKAKPAKKASSAKKAAPKPKKKAASAKKKATKKSTTTKTVSSSNYVCASGELYSQSEKGKLVQSLLARWWYAYDWPDQKSLPASTPVGYDALDGFPGVYICTQGAEVGKFLDKRDRTKAPTFNNFAKKSSEELKDMLLRAIDAQLKALIQREGGGTDTEKELKVLEKWANKLNCAKADKQAEKVLKAKRLTLS